MGRSSSRGWHGIQEVEGSTPFGFTSISHATVDVLLARETLGQREILEVTALETGTIPRDRSPEPGRGAPS